MRWARAIGLLAMWSTVAFATPVTFSGATNHRITLQSGTHADWLVQNQGGTSNGTPNGTCTSAVAGLAILDATLEPGGVNKDDAVDNGFTVWVDGVQFVSPDTVDFSDQTLTAGPVSMSGLDVTVEYKALQSSPTLRARVTLHNPTSAPIEAGFRLATNFGSDGDTAVRAGTPTQSWAVTSDSLNAPSDPVLLMVRTGPFDRAPFSHIPVGGVSEGTFDCNGTEGVEYVTQSLRVPPGETLYVMQFLELFAVVNDAADASAGFEVTPPTDPETTADLSEAVLDATVNWNFFGNRILTAGDGKWIVNGFVATSDRQASGGTCAGAPGIGLDDAEIANSTFTDAFDGGQVLFVDGHQLTPPIAEHDAANSVSFGPQTLSGLDVTESYAAFEPNILRTVVTLHNPTAASISTTVEMASNFGSDGNTVVLASSNGNTSIESGDLWVVTADDATTPSDAVNTSVVAGPGPILPVAPDLSDAVFSCTKTNGILSRFALTLGPGQSQSLLFLNSLNRTVADAVDQTSTLAEIPRPDDPILADLGATTLARVVNWALCRDSTYPDAACRIDGLSADASDAGTAGKTLSKLLTRLTAAKTALGKALTAAAAAKQRAARGQLKAVTASLKTFEKLLKSKKVSAVLGEDARARLAGTSIDLRRQIKGLPTRVITG